MRSGPFLERIELPDTILEKRTTGIYHTTGFRKDQILDLCVRIHKLSQEQMLPAWPPILGLRKSIIVALTYLRRNRVQAEIGEMFEVSQPTISRAVKAMTEVLGRVLSDYVPVAEDLDPRSQYIVDGTLLPCWSWRDHSELYSGKHKTTGLNVQVVCDLYGRLAWISDPVDGRRHDTAALELSGVIETLDPGNWMGDKGYIGNNMITPFRKPAHRELLDWERQFNADVNKIRYMIERTIANVKTWRILHTDYRRPLATFTETISTVVALLFYKISCE
jgi:DDE superfamily endonuclease/Helix-turn-helix of DDE superfamily endonuclease